MRRQPTNTTIYEVRGGRRHLQAAEVARAWWVGTHASAILVHDAGADLDGQALQRASTTSPEASILRALVLAAPGSTVVSVDAYREDEFPGADTVLSIGRPLGPDDTIPDYVEPIRSLIEGSGGSVRRNESAWSLNAAFPPRVKRVKVQNMRPTRSSCSWAPVRFTRSRA